MLSTVDIISDAIASKENLKKGKCLACNSENISVNKNGICFRCFLKAENAKK